MPGNTEDEYQAISHADRISRGETIPRVESVVIDGDKATAKVRGHEMHFGRVDGRWFMRRR